MILGSLVTFSLLGRFLCTVATSKAKLLHARHLKHKVFEYTLAKWHLLLDPRGIFSLNES